MNVAAPASSHRSQRILYVITKANWGGAQRYVYDLALASAEMGHEVSVACGNEGELSKRLFEAHIPVFFVRGLGRDVAPLADLRALLHLFKLIHSLQPDILHANSSKAGLLATVAGYLSRKSARSCKIIFTAHGWSFNESRPGWQRAIFTIFHAITVAASDTIICVSDAVRRDAQRLPFTQGKLRVIHNGITHNDEQEMMNAGGKQQARAALTPAGTPIFSCATWIGTLAELHPTKGLDIAIQAFARIAPNFPETALVLIGEGQQRNRLVELVRSHHLQDRVSFSGHVPHAASLLSAFDIFLFPSRSEALGYAALEAGLVSLPVVASHVGGIPEIIEDKISGLLVPVDDVEGFANALTTLLIDPELRAKLGQSLQKRVLTSFSHDAMIAKTLALYENP